MEAAPVPSAEGGKGRISQQLGNVGQPKPTVREVLADLLDAHAIEQFAEAGLLPVQAPLKSPDVGTESVGHPADRCTPRRHEQANRLFDFL